MNCAHCLMFLYLLYVLQLIVVHQQLYHHEDTQLSATFFFCFIDVNDFNAVKKKKKKRNKKKVKKNKGKKKEKVMNVNDEE